MGKTVTTELAYFHPGKTTNPHDYSRTPGGSSQATPPLAKPAACHARPCSGLSIAKPNGCERLGHVVYADCAQLVRRV